MTVIGDGNEDKQRDQLAEIQSFPSFFSLDIRSLLSAGAVTLIFYSISNYLFDLSICIFSAFKYFFLSLSFFSNCFCFFICSMSSLLSQTQMKSILCLSRNYLSKLCKFKYQISFFNKLPFESLSLDRFEGEEFSLFLSWKLLKFSNSQRDSCHDW